MNHEEYPLNVATPRSFTYVTRDIPRVTAAQRERALKATHYNEFAFPACICSLRTTGRTLSYGIGRYCC